MRFYNIDQRLLDCNISNTAHIKPIDTVPPWERGREGERGGEEAGEEGEGNKGKREGEEQIGRKEGWERGR